MLKRLIVGLISLSFLFQSFIFSSPVYASPVMTTENSQAVHKIPFSNSIEFYQKLYDALKSNEPIVIQTDFKSYEEFPKDLKKIVKVDPSNSSIAAVGALPGAGITSGVASILSLGTVAGLSGAGITSGLAGLVSMGALPGGICALAGSANFKESEKIVKVDPSNSSIAAVGGLSGAGITSGLAGVVPMGALPGGICALAGSANFKELEKIVKVDPSNSSIVVDRAVGQLPNLMMPALLNEKALDLMICVTITGTGAAIGGLVGGPFGALAGGGLGGGVCLIKDTVDKAFQSQDHWITVGCGPNGCTITIKPTKPASSVA